MVAQLLRQTAGSLRLAALVVASCAPGWAGMKPADVRHVPYCPDTSAEVDCMTPIRCIYDDKRGCESCYCDSPGLVPYERETPSGRPMLE